MKVNLIKPNLYIIEKGKLIPQSTTIEQKKKNKNYRYIPYDPLNNPDPQDYFRQTISRLEKQNTCLKKQLNLKLEEQTSRKLVNRFQSNTEQIKKYQLQIKTLKQEIYLKQKQLLHKNQQLKNKDKQIVEIGNENTHLHIQTDTIIKQVQSLNNLMQKKNEQIETKKEQLQYYCKVLQQLTIKEKQQKNTNFTENNFITSRIQEKGDEEDEICSFENYSLKDRYQIDKKQDFKINIDSLGHRSDKQLKYYNFRSARNLQNINKDDQRSMRNNQSNEYNYKNTNKLTSHNSQTKLTSYSLDQFNSNMKINPISMNLLEKISYSK